MSKRKRLSGKALENEMQGNAELRREIFEGLLRHLRAGYSLDCYGPVGQSTIEEFTKSYPNEFNVGELIEATREAKQGWEQLGRHQADGSCIGNSRSWVYNMINRYDWTDKTKVETTGTQAVNVNIVSYTSTQASDNSTKGDV